VLAVWLLIELVGYFAISPYPAVRRLLGVGIAASVLAARAASLRPTGPEVRGGVRIAVASGLALGALYFGAELSDARARSGVIARAVEQLPQLGVQPDRETVWYVGHWELQFYAERAGMRPVIAGRSQLRPGDWLLLCAGTVQPALDFPNRGLRQRSVLPAASPWPWSTIPRYYDGVIPLRRQPETQSVIRIFRVLRGITPRLKTR
jgi:hypothetical protein